MKAQIGNGNKAGMPEASNINMYIESPIPQSHEEDSSVTNRNSCRPTAGGRSKSRTLLCEDPSPSRSPTWPFPLNPSQDVTIQLAFLRWVRLWFQAYGFERHEFSRRFQVHCGQQLVWATVCIANW